ncbi:MAG: hypothetical protein BroJett040_24110 [Oligoflexia bacterium]|nr:MAG: hypothetical protein BroJett040_24110 [Oligoflexia bacterium]
MFFIAVPFLFLSSLTSFGAEDTLFFPIDKNNVKVLNQSFEYKLIDKDNFKVGDVLMNANQFELHIDPENRDGKYKIKFKWPSGMITKGEIVLKDNAGKIIWKTPISPESLKIEKSQIEQRGDIYRTDVATFETESLDEATLKKLQLYPFFKYCIQRTEELTSLFLCSKDLYYKEVDKGFSIQSRDSFRRESHVEINGKVVGEQGMIILQSKKNPVSMKALLLSGASIEANTRLTDVDFKDFYSSQEGKKIFVRAVGAEPAKEELITKREADGWWMELDINRPIFYVKGEGDIPMRQEFIVSGKPRSESLKVPYASTPSLKTYSSEETVALKKSSDYSLSVYDKNSSLRDNGTSYLWTIKNLAVGELNRGYLKVKSKDGEYVAAHDILRGKRHEFNAKLHIPNTAVSLRLEQWITLRWGWALGYDHYITKGASEPHFSITSIEGLMRFTPGLHYVDKSHGISLGYNIYKADSVSIGSPTIGGYLVQAAPKKWNKYFQWINYRIKLPLGGKGNDFKLSTAYQLEALLKWQTSTAAILELGTRLESYQFQSELAQSSNYTYSRTLLFGGISWLF